MDTLSTQFLLLITATAIGAVLAVFFLKLKHVSLFHWTSAGFWAWAFFAVKRRKGNKRIMNRQYIQYGCGYNAPKSWRNFDASPTLRFERLPIIGGLYTKNKSRFPQNIEYGDIVKGLPVPGGSCKAAYCSHILEHLSLEDFRKALRNTYGILKKGGIFRFVLPDLEYSIKKYNRDPTHEAAITFLKETSLGKEKKNRGIKGFVLEWLGNSQHLWMWDYKSIERELSEAGFIEIRRAQFTDSSDPMFKEVEDKGRWDNCLGVECKK